MARVGVFADKFSSGADALEHAEQGWKPGEFDGQVQVPQLAVCEIDDALQTPWDTDAHFASYVCTLPKGLAGLSSESWPRINKTLLGEIQKRALGLGRSDGGLVCETLILDLDRKHVGELADKLLDRLAELEKVGFVLAACWYAWYRTKGGSRLIYVFAPGEAPPVLEFEDHYRWVLAEFAKVGIGFDPSCADWTRLFRLPRVVRDGVPTDEQDYFAEEFRREVLYRELLGKIADPRGTSEYAELIAVTGGQPTPEEADALLFSKSSFSGRLVQTEFYKGAKHQLQGRECWKAIFDHQRIDEETYNKDHEDSTPPATWVGRDETIVEYVGQATSLLIGKYETTPQHIYALFLPAVEQLEPDRDTPSWPRKLWDVVKRFWSKEDAKTRKEEEQKQEQIEQLEQEQLALIDRMVLGVREWLPELSDDPLEASEWVMAHMIAYAPGGHHFVMMPNGRYSALAVDKDALPNQIEKYGLGSPDHCEGLIPLMVPRKDGEGFRHASYREITAGRMIPVRSVDARPETGGGFLEGVGRDENPKLVVESYSRNKDLTPCFDDMVDCWLRLVGGTQYEDLATYIGRALAFEKGPMAVLAIIGPKGIGKTLIVQGLAECLASPVLATGDDLVGSFNAKLLFTPFCNVDEGWPSDWKRHPADIIRVYSGGGKPEVNRKYREVVTVNNNLRIILTANSAQIILDVGKGKTFSPDDRAALAERFFVLEPNSDARDWLVDMGGRSFTKGWIAGADGVSHYRVARHFLWLYEKYGKNYEPSGRFLFEGSESPIVNEMANQGGSTPVVIETLVQLLQKKGDDATNGKKGVAVTKDKRLFVLASAVMEAWRQSSSKSNTEKLTPSGVLFALKGILAAPNQKPFRANGIVGRWHEVDVSLLAQQADRFGWMCPRLMELAGRTQDAQITPLQLIEAEIANEGVVNGR